MKARHVGTFLSLMTLIFAVHCGSDDSQNSSTITGVVVEGNEARGNARVVFNDFEGGFYAIIDANGQKFDPVNLSAEFQTDGLNVAFIAIVLIDQVSVHNWGQVVEIQSIAVSTGDFDYGYD